MQRSGEDLGHSHPVQQPLRPAPVQVYLTTLEAVKSAVAERSAAVGTGEAGAAGLANFVAGATASLVTQSVIVPVRAV